MTRLLADEAAAAGDADGATRYYLRILERDAYDEAAHLGLVGALLAAGRHGEARRRYGIYGDRMDEMGVEAAPFPSRARVDGRRRAPHGDPARGNGGLPAPRAGRRRPAAASRSSGPE